MTQVKIRLEEIKIATKVIQQLQFKDEHNQYVVYKNLKIFNPIIEEEEDNQRYKNIGLAEVNEKNHIIKDQNNNMIFNTENTIILEKFSKELGNKIFNIDVIKFRKNDEINKLPIALKYHIDFLLPELVIEPKEEKDVNNKGI